MVCGVDWPRVAGVKVAYVGGFASPAGGSGDDASWEGLEGLDMCSSQGVSCGG